MSFTKALNKTIFRKVALSVWKSAADPSVYGFVELDLTDSLIQGTPLPYIIKSLSIVMLKYPDLNSILRWGSIYHRRNVNISVLVDIPNIKKNDLSLSTLENVDQMSLENIHEKLHSSVKLIRRKEDPQLGYMLKLIEVLPLFLIKSLLNIYSFLVYELKTNLNLKNIPKNPFGSVIITNVGTLGITKALVPLVPLTRSVMLISVGKAIDEVKVINGNIEIRKIIHLGVTYDHRFFDGAHAALMLNEFQKQFEIISRNQ